MKRIFVCSPLAGDISGNTVRAREYCRAVIRAGFLPYAPHLFFPQLLDELDPAGRAQGIELGLNELIRCDEVWAFGDRISEGMSMEIAEAEELGLHVRYFTGTPINELDAVIAERFRRQTELREGLEDDDELALFDELRADSREAFIEKNRAYGGAYKLFGLLGVVIRIGDKLMRAFNLIMTGANGGDEKLADTLKDLENYATIARITERRGNVRGLFW